MLGYSLTLGDARSWHAFEALIMAPLSEKERAALAYSALRSLCDDDAYLTASFAIFGVLKGEVVA